MKKMFRFSMIALTFWVALSFAPAVSAHPLGNFTINHYAGLDIRPGSIEIDFIIDMAEIPAFQEISGIDRNEDQVADEGERAGYASQRCQALGADLRLIVGGKSEPLALSQASLSFPPGQGGLSTLRLECRFAAAFAFSNELSQLSFQDLTYPERLGWREIVVFGEGLDLRGDYSSATSSDRLRSYPEDMLASPLDQREVSLELAPQGLGAEKVADAPSGSAGQAGDGVVGDRNDPFTRLIQTERFTVVTLLFALAISFAWGAMHAMTPGHGKTIVGAYLVGSRGTAWHAVYLGLTTTVAHTAGVFALGGVTLFASRYLLPEKLFPWLNLLSGLLVVGIGAQLFFGRLKNARRGDTNHEHNHAHEDFHSHTHGEGQHHDHEHEGESTLHSHSHSAPGGDGSPVTWRSLLALGISGGLLPCPSALIVMLGAIALERIGLGMVLVLAFSLGLASALTIIGLAFLYAGRLFERLPVQNQLLRYVPIGSAAFITLAGLGIALRALSTL